MRNKYNSLDKTIIETLLGEDDISIKEHSHLLQFNPVSLLDSLERLSAENFIIFNENGSVSRSKYFFEEVLAKRWDIFKREMAWKKPRLTKR